MPSDATNRYSVYRNLMEKPEHWQATLGIATCKMLRQDRNRPAFNRVLELLSSEAFRTFISDRGWHLAFTGGTFESLWPTLRKSHGPERLHGLAPSALGLIQFSNLVIFGHLRAIFFFNDMEDFYADSPQNLSMRRICNHYNVPLFEDFSSIDYILNRWISDDKEPATRLGQFPQANIDAYFGDDEVLFRDDLPPAERNDRSRETIAIVSHNEMKMKMLNFCLRHMNKILSYKRVLTTGTTGARLIDQYTSALSVLLGNQVSEATLEGWGWTPAGETVKEFLERKIRPFESGPEGGDIQISSKIIDGTCHRVLFFEDPQTAHPHQFDIRLMEKATQDQATAVLFATSEETAELIV